MLRVHKPRPQPNVILDSNLDLQSNLDSDPDVCEMLRIHYLVGVSHFAECRENWLVTAREMLINRSSLLFRNVEGRGKVIWHSYHQQK